MKIVLQSKAERALSVNLKGFNNITIEGQDEHTDFVLHISDPRGFLNKVRRAVEDDATY